MAPFARIMTSCTHGTVSQVPSTSPASSAASVSEPGAHEKRRWGGHDCFALAGPNFAMPTL
jgi:hypothetical protein